MFIPIDYRTLVQDLLPYPVLYTESGNTLLRNVKERDWNYLMTNPVIYNYNILLNYYNDTMYKVNHNGQIMSLEHYLNDFFGITGVTITDGASSNETFIFRKIEPILITQEKFIYNLSEGSGVTEVFLLNVAETLTSTYDFIVNVPSVFYADVVLSNLIDKAVKIYKPAGTIYILLPY